MKPRYRVRVFGYAELFTTVEASNAAAAKEIARRRFHEGDDNFTGIEEVEAERIDRERDA